MMCAVGCKNRFSAKCADCLRPDGIGGFYNANFAEDESTHVTFSSAVGASGDNQNEEAR